MANVFVWSGASGANDGTTWEDAFQDFYRDYSAVSGFVAATDIIFIRDSHSETDLSASTNRFTPDTTFLDGSSPTRVRCVVGADTGTTPGNLSTGAVVAWDGTTSTAGFQFRGGFDIYGVTFRFGSTILVGDSFNTFAVFDTCTVDLDRNVASEMTLGSDITIASHDIRFKNVTFEATNVGSYLGVKGGNASFESCTWSNNVTSMLQGVAAPSGVAIYRFFDCDLSAQSGNLVDPTGFNEGLDVLFSRCTLHASATPVITTTLDHPFTVRLFHCQSGTDADPSFAVETYTFMGRVITDTARYRDQSVSDGLRTNPVSLDMDTTVGTAAYPYLTVASPPILAFLPGDGSVEYTVRGYFASGGTQQDDDVWMEMSRVNDAATSSLGVRDTTRVAPETAAANHSTDSLSTWTGTGVGTKQYTEKAFTPDKPGAISVEFMAVGDAGAAGHVYFDPFLEVRDANGNILVRRAWIDPRNGGYIMEFTSPKAQSLIGVM